MNYKNSTNAKLDGKTQKHFRFISSFFFKCHLYAHWHTFILKTSFERPKKKKKFSTWTKYRYLNSKLKKWKVNLKFKHAENERARTFNAMQHGRDAKSQWCRIFGWDRLVWWARANLFWECSHRIRKKQQPYIHSAIYVVVVLKIRCIVRNGEVVRFFPFFFIFLSFLGSEEFYLRNIAIWPIRKHIQNSVTK